MRYKSRTCSQGLRLAGEQVLKFLKDTKIDLHKLASQLDQRVTHAKTRALRCKSALQLLDQANRRLVTYAHNFLQGATSPARQRCSELLLLHINKDNLHFMEGLNGCGRPLRAELTKLWHRCIADIVMPLIAEPVA